MSRRVSVEFDATEEQKQRQNDCDHDWEFCDTFKVCTYPECQLEKELTKEEISWANNEAYGGNDFY